MVSPGDRFCKRVIIATCQGMLFPCQFAGFSYYLLRLLFRADESDESIPGQPVGLRET
jgi:hypothetical protein